MEELNAPGNTFHNACASNAHIPVRVSTVKIVGPFSGRKGDMSSSFWLGMNPCQENTPKHPANLLDSEKIIC